jgi:hypothetical protein
MESLPEKEGGTVTKSEDTIFHGLEEMRVIEAGLMK